MPNQQTIESQNNAEFINSLIELKKLGQGAFGVVSLVLYNNLKGLLVKSGLACEANYYSISQKSTIYQTSNDNNDNNDLLPTHSLCVLKQESHRSIEHRNKLSGENDKLSEPKILSNLAHPFIIGYIAHTFNHEKLYLIQEFFDGQELKQVILGKKQLSQNFSSQEVLFVVFQLAMALEYLHRHGIYHRDLKSSNILINNRCLIKLIDFGFAEKSLNMHSASKYNTDVVGTPYYMSPQAVSRLVYTDKTDCWSLGIIFYELLTLKKPFEGGTFQILANSIYFNSYAALPIQLSCFKYLIDGLLEKHESRRFSIKEFLNTKEMQSIGLQFIRYYETLVNNIGTKADHNWLCVLKEHYGKIISKPGLSSKQELALDKILRKEQYELIQNERILREKYEKKVNDFFQQFSVYMEKMRPVSSSNTSFKFCTAP